MWSALIIFFIVYNTKADINCNEGESISMFGNCKDYVVCFNGEFQNITCMDFEPIYEPALGKCITTEKFMIAKYGGLVCHEGDTYRGDHIESYLECHEGNLLKKCCSPGEYVVETLGKNECVGPTNDSSSDDTVVASRIFRKILMYKEQLKLNNMKSES